LKNATKRLARPKAIATKVPASCGIYLVLIIFELVFRHKNFKKIINIINIDSKENKRPFFCGL
jgi:hypothetical protein